jgi:hypothetical protein
MHSYTLKDVFFALGKELKNLVIQFCSAFDCESNGMQTEIIGLDLPELMLFYETLENRLIGVPSRTHRF